MGFKAKQIAVVGCGYWGKNLARNLYELGVLGAICDIDSAKLDDLRDKMPDIKAVSDYDKIIAFSSIQSVAIAVPAVKHYELTQKAILAGKDVFVEKPLALNVKKARELVELAKTKNKILMVGHLLQYHPAVLKLKEIISKGELGKIQYIYSNRLNIGKLRVEENILWSFAPHDISVILMLLGEEPIKVWARGGDYLNKGIQDTTLTSLEFRNGIKGHIFVSWLHPYKEQKLVVVGSKAMAVFDDVSEEKLSIYPHQIEWKDGKIPIAHKAQRRVVEIDKKEPLKEELRHFIECVCLRKQPRTDGLEAIRVLNVLEAAEISLREGV